MNLLLYTGPRPMGYGKTDATGGYVFADVPDGEYGVFADSLPAGYHGTEALIGGPTSRLRDGLTVSATSSPVVSLTLVQEGPGTVDVRVTKTSGGVFSGIPVSLNDNYAHWRSGQTDSTGKYTFTAVPFGLYFASVANPDQFETPTSPTRLYSDPIAIDSGASKSVTMQLSPCTGSVAVRVLDDVSAGEAAFPLRLYTSMGVLQETVTDASGTHTFANLECGYYGVSIRPKAGYSYVDAPGLAYNSVLIRRGTLTTFTYRVLPPCTGSVAVRVLDDVSAGVAAFPLRLYTSTGVLQETVTDASGTYTFANLACGGDYGVSIRPKAGYTYVDALGLAYNGVLIERRSLTTFTYRVSPLCTGSVAVRVLGGDGSGVAAFPLRLYTSTGVLQETVTDASGTYTFANLACGDYGVSIRPKAGYTYVDELGLAYNTVLIGRGTSTTFTYRVSP
ncbi:MAG: hypothetical protein NTU67_09965 [Gemmatimonadetes bacterium]|nr:hypothetical protein [Gemmatimonadota bacterium]